MKFSLSLNRKARIITGLVMLLIAFTWLCACATTFDVAYQPETSAYFAESGLVPVLIGVSDNRTTENIVTQNTGLPTTITLARNVEELIEDSLKSRLAGSNFKLADSAEAQYLIGVSVDNYELQFIWGQWKGLVRLSISVVDAKNRSKVLDSFSVTGQASRFNLLGFIDAKGALTQAHNTAVNSVNLQRIAEAIRQASTAPIILPGEKPFSTPVLSVLDFRIENIPLSEGNFLVELLTSTLFETGRFRIIEKSQRENILNETEFSLSDCAEEECQIEVGKLLAADFIVVGSIGRVSNRYVLGTKMLQVANGETVSSAYEIYRTMDEVVDNCRAIAKALSDGLGF